MCHLIENVFIAVMQVTFYFLNKNTNTTVHKYSKSCKGFDLNKSTNVLASKYSKSKIIEKF